MTENRLDVRAEGRIVLDQPFATCPPDTADSNGRQLLPRLPVYAGGAFSNTPYIPAAVLKGKLRRAAAAEIADLFRAAGEDGVDFQTHLLNAVGGVKGTARTRMPPKEAMEIIEKNNLLAMFGAGENRTGVMVGARLHVSHAIPDGDVTVGVVKGARAHEDKNPALVEFLREDAWERVDQFQKANADRAKLRQAVKEKGRALKTAAAEARKGKAPLPPEELAELQRSVEEDRKLLDDAEELAKSALSDVSLGMPLPGYEVLPRGLELPHEFSIGGSRPDQIGLVLAAFERFARSPVIGAHVAHGCGRISGSYDLYARARGSTAFEAVGRLRFGGRDGMETDGETPVSWLQAWREKPFAPDDYRAILP